MELNFENFNAVLCSTSSEAALVKYIFETQGDEARHVDFNAAANYIKCSRRSVSRYTKELVKLKILELVNLGGGWGYRLCPEIIKDKE